MPTGRPHPPEFKAKVVMQVISGEKTLNDVAAEYDLNPNLVRKWRNKFEREAYRAFSATEDDKARERELAEHREEVDDLYRMIGRARMYLVAVIDWFSRHVIGWRLLDDMGAAGAVACMRDAIGARGAPAMANPDQGSVRSSAAYEQLLEDAHVLQSMDGKARWAAFVIVERWFRSLKSECVKIEERETPRELRGIVDECVRKYNDRRLHESLDYETPASWRYSGIAAQLAA